MKGKIIKSTGSWYDILDENGDILKGKLRGKFKNYNFKTTNPLCVGDNVEFAPVENDEIVQITNILKRDNYIIRKSVHKQGTGHIIASNIDIAVLVCTLKQPKTSLGFIDRFLVSAESFRIPTILAFNKVDLHNEEDLAEIEEIKNIYTPLGYQIIEVSATENSNIDTIKEILQGKTALFAGHSGVGKSTLLNSISPELNLKTGEISSAHEKGKHTTTFAEMMIVNTNTFIIDSPGIQEMGLINLEKEHVSHYFPEMRELINECKFNNCLHIKEPQCAVKEALENGDIEPSRYYHYMGIVEEEDFKFR